MVLRPRRLHLRLMSAAEAVVLRHVVDLMLLTRLLLLLHQRVRALTRSDLNSLQPLLLRLMVLLAGSSDLLRVHFMLSMSSLIAFTLFVLVTIMQLIGVWWRITLRHILHSILTSVSCVAMASVSIYIAAARVVQ